MPPLGWQFLPAEVTVDIDGATDDCSRQHDINFVFAGFGVVGQLLVGGAAGQQQQQQPGPPGVQIDLLTAAAAANAAGTVLQSTVTDREGRFVFTAVPGAEELMVRATHAAWQFAKATGAVTMTGDNGVAENLLIRGFDVGGRVVAAGDSQPMAGVSIFIFGPPAAAGSFAGLPGCADLAASDIPDFATPEGLVPLCRTVSGPDGAFLFPVVPPGTAAYRLVPHYRGELTRYEVIPASRELTVGLDSVRLDEPFVVAGFSVRGRVLRTAAAADKEAMAAVQGTIVTLEGGSRRRYEAKTDAEGFYLIEKLEAGTYVLTAAAEGIEYPKVRRERIFF